MDRKTKPEIIKSVPDGDKQIRRYPSLTTEELRRKYRAFSTRASEINRSEGWQHYRVAIVAVLAQIIITAERRDYGRNQNEARRA